MPPTFITSPILITRAPQAEDLLPISLATLPLTSNFGVNIYLKTRPIEPPLLFNAAHNPISRQQFEDLMRTESSNLYIHRQDHDLYQQAVRQCWQTLLLDRSLPIQQRLAAVYELARESLSEQLGSGETDAIVQTCHYYAAASATVFQEESVTACKLSSLLHHDHRLETRAINGAAYATLLGCALGMNDFELKQLATGAMLRDLGMLDIDAWLLNKPGRLLDGERRTLQTHPALGLQRVMNRVDLSEGAVKMIYQHHERCDGSGYPVGISGSEMHPWSCLCAIVDVYDALTSGRPHRQATSRQTALAVLERGSNTLFDGEMVTSWLRC